MKSASWKDVAELIGIATIVASLIFVGLQMKQNQEIALASQYQARAEATMSLHQTFIEVGRIPRIPSLRNGTSDKISAQDINEQLWLWIAMDNHYFQYRSGFLDELAWQGQLNSIKEMYSTCDMRFVFDWRKNGLRTEFVAVVEALEDPCSAME